MSESIGRIVLRKAAQFYRDNPKRWCRGYGSLKEIAEEGDIAAINKALSCPDEKGCMYVTIMLQSALVAGKRARGCATNEAVKLLYGHHLQLRRLDASGTMAIMIVNDHEEYCRDVEQAITFLEAPLHTAKVAEERMLVSA